MPSTLPFSQLQVFLAVARNNSFSGAARELGISRSAVSQAVRQLEEHLRVVLVQRTTRSVALTEPGRRLVDGVAPALAQTAATLAEVAAKPGEVTGRLKLTLPGSARAQVIEPVLPVFRARYPRVEVELAIEDRRVDIVAAGFDAGIRLSEIVERDMVQARLTKPFRYVVVGAPSYLREHGAPRRPEDLLRHECITFRSPTTGVPYAWELERGAREWRVPVRGGVITNEGMSCARLAALGLGFAYVAEPDVLAELKDGRLELVLEAYAAEVPGWFLYFPGRAQRSAPLRAFGEIARKVLLGRR